MAVTSRRDHRECEEHLKLEYFATCKLSTETKSNQTLEQVKNCMSFRRDIDCRTGSYCISPLILLSIDLFTIDAGVQVIVACSFYSDFNGETWIGAEWNQVPPPSPICLFSNCVQHIHMQYAPHMQYLPTKYSSRLSVMIGESTSAGLRGAETTVRATRNRHSSFMWQSYE